MLNYMDRQTIALVRPQIRDAFAIKTDEAFGWIIAVFGMIYALLQVPAGYVVDRWNLRCSYAAAVVWWSFAAMATALAPSLGFFVVCRALLGVGESFNWPCALRVTARVLPPAERSLGNGIFNSGAAVGAVVTPFVVTKLTLAYGWRTAFLVPGVVGLVWVAAWLFLVQGPHRASGPAVVRRIPPGNDGYSKPGLPARVRFAFAFIVFASVVTALLAIQFGPLAVWLGIALFLIGPLLAAAAFPLGELAGAVWASSLGEIVRQRRFWIMAVVSITINICWHFLVNWVPAYFKDERHLEYAASNFVSAIPFLAAAFGNVAGGWLARRFVALGLSTDRARQAVLVVCMVLIQAGIGVGFARRHDCRCLALDHGRWNRGLHGQLFRLCPGSQPAAYRIGRGISGRTRQSLRGWLSAVCGQSQRCDWKLIARFLAGDDPTADRSRCGLSRLASAGPNQE